MKCCLQAVEKTPSSSLPLSVQPTWRRCRRNRCYLHQFREQYAHRRLPPQKGWSRDSRRRSVRLLPRLPRKQFPTHRRCVHVLHHHAERLPRFHFIQNDQQRHHAILPDTPAAWQLSTCKQQRRRPCPSSRSKNVMSLFCSIHQKPETNRTSRYKHTSSLP